MIRNPMRNDSVNSLSLYIIDNSSTPMTLLKATHLGYKIVARDRWISEKIVVKDDEEKEGKKRDEKKERWEKNKMRKERDKGISFFHIICKY